MKRVETVILGNLLYNEEYMRKVIPFLHAGYFTDPAEQIVYSAIHSFVEQYNSLPTVEALEVLFLSDNKISETQYKEIEEILGTLQESKADLQWLLDTTEKFCRDRAVYIALRSSIKIANGEDKTRSPDAIPEILQQALAVSFDRSIGHDYLEDGEQRYDFYTRVEERIPFGLDKFNEITRGGLPRKTLNVVIAGVGVGKSLFLCDFAASCLMKGKNVLYITLEMSEERIAERIDMNLMNMISDDLALIPKQTFLSRISTLSKKTQGKLFIKEYPTAAAHTGHFRALLRELRTKKNFSPDIVFVDYINICASSRYKSDDKYSLIKAISEELRGLGVEFNVPIMSATQLNRTGFASSDVEMTDTAESWGLPATADLLFALMETEELERLGQYMVKQLKNRYAKKTTNRRFVIGVDKDKMRVFNVEESAQPKGDSEDDPPNTGASTTVQKFFKGKDTTVLLDDDPFSDFKL